MTSVWLCSFCKLHKVFFVVVGLFVLVFFLGGGVVVFFLLFLFLCMIWATMHNFCHQLSDVIFLFQLIAGKKYCVHNKF